MPVNTISVGAAVTPTVIHTYLSHYINRRTLHQKPTAHISYHEGLELIRRFLRYASFHTVDELQAFTSQRVPVPRWVHVTEVEIAHGQLLRSADHINAQLGPEGITAVGGKTWWQWRREGTTLQAEWIEMRKDYDARKQLNMAGGDRIMLYVHGGAYFFGSVDEHRYQLQRHARKLKARVLAPKYRLAPQFPFPCGLHDCLAAYLYLLDENHDPSTIILAGDSAGGGMVLSMLVTLRDQGIPLPAGAILISPWVDLTHSFPSLGGDGKMDYIPAHGFIHKPSMSWPPPNADDLLEFEHPSQASLGPSGTGQGMDTWISPDGKYSIGPKSMLAVQLENDVRVEIKDQIQLYAANHLLTHPLVSPALQPTLGGLPPLLIQTGGGELLRDEQIYLAHKAAQPLAYLPPPSNNQTAEEIQAQAAKYRPTNVQLQVWDDLCHVCPTLSFTRPAKYMYRSVAQFGAWALARAQKKSIDILDDDDISMVSSGSCTSSGSNKAGSDSSFDDPELSKAQQAPETGTTKLEKVQHAKVKVGRAGDPLPPFERHMIRQRIDRHGHVFPLAAKEELVALNLPSVEVGVPKTGPVSKWTKAQQQWNNKFAKQKIKIQKQRIKDMENGFEGFDGETPPPTALAGRRVKGMRAEKAKKKSWGMAMWSGWGSKHDETTIVREEKADHKSEQADASKTTTEPGRPSTDGAAGDKQQSKQKRGRSSKLAAPDEDALSRSRSRHSAVTDQGQAGASLEDLSRVVPQTPGLAEATVLAPERIASAMPSPQSELSSPGLPPPGIVVSDDPKSPHTLIPATDTLTTRPTKGGVAYPFSLRVEGPEGKDVNASTLTLQSVNIMTPALEGEQTDTESGAGVGPASDTSNKDEAGKQRSGMEQYFTAGPGAGLFSSGVQDERVGHAEKVERPPVERFETAQESLNTVAGAGIGGS